MNATHHKQRMRADLKIAMQARALDEVRLLRALIAAIDNAEAVPAEQGLGTAGQRAFGDPGGEVARRELDDERIHALLAAETDDRLAAAAEYARHGRDDDAARLRAEAALIGRYREA